MNRRSFLKAVPALAAGAILPAVVISEGEKILVGSIEVNGVPSPPINVEMMTDEFGNVLVARTENPLTKQFHEFPVSLSGWEPVNLGQH